MKESDYFTGQLLLAMPGMGDPRFHKSVIFICMHDEKGAMGLVINQAIPGLSFGPLLQQLDILPENSLPHALRDKPVFTGGPIEQSRGFLLHDETYHGKDTIPLSDSFGITCTTDGLRDLAQSIGPHATRFILGYAGWGAGQLEQELQDNAWLTIPPTKVLVFETQPAHQWEKAYTALGITPSALSSDSGRA